MKHTWPNEWQVSPRNIREFIQHHPSEWCQAIVNNNQVTGFFLVSWADQAVISPESTSRLMSDNRTLWLKTLFVFPEACCQGLGRRLVEEARNIAWAHGAECLDLNVLDKDRHLVDFYKNKGFVYVDSCVDDVTGNTEHHMTCLTRQTLALYPDVS